MIARAAARGDPQQAVQYILHGKGGEQPDRAEYVTTRNFAEPETPEAAGPTLAFLTADAATERPLYQVILSLPKGEHFTPEQVERVTDRVLWSLGAQDRLTVVALHRDGDGRGGDRRGGQGGKDHLHILINRVGPDGRLLNLRGDRYRLQVAMATLEVEHGWRRVAELPLGHELTDEQLRSAATTLETPFSTLVEPEIARTVERAGSWGELHEALGGQGLRLQRRFDGMWVTDGFERAAIDPSVFERLGRFERSTRLPMEAAPLRQRLALHAGQSLEQRSARAVDHLTEHDVVFSRRQLAAVAAWDRAPEMLRQSVVGAREVLRAGDGEYTTARAVLEEEHVLLLGEALARRNGATIPLGTEHLHGLDPGQRDALATAASGSGLALITGRAGTGKTTTLARVRSAYEAAGWRVVGAAPTGKAAEGLHKDAGISSSTVAGLLLLWGEGKDLPVAKTIVLVDEAGMVGTGDMRRLLEVAEAQGARVRLVGDANQLAPVAGGQPFRALGERHGAALMETVWRQREKWQQDATSKLANFQIADALRDYATHQRVEGYRTREQAIRGLVAEYVRDVEAHPQGTRLALAATKADRGRINAALRAALVERGLVGAETVSSAAGELAVGDRVVFRRNDHVARHVKLLDARGRVVELAPGSRDGVKNGSLGTVIRARGDQVDVGLDDGRSVRFNPRTWQKVEHAYALHVDLAQGATVDRAYVLAGERFQRNGAYVALSRHRDDVKVFFDREMFPDRDALAERFGRGRYKQNLADLAVEAREALSGRARVVYGLRAAPWSEPARLVAEGGRAMQEEPRTESRTEAATRAALTEIPEPSRLDLVEAELRLQQVDGARAWRNVQGLVDQHLAEPEKALDAMRRSLQRASQHPTSDAIEAGLRASQVQSDVDVDALRVQLRPRLVAVQDHEHAVQHTERRIEALKSERIGAPEHRAGQFEALKSERIGSPEVATPEREMRAGRIDSGEASRLYRDALAREEAWEELPASVRGLKAEGVRRGEEVHLPEDAPRELHEQAAVQQQARRALAELHLGGAEVDRLMAESQAQLEKLSPRDRARAEELAAAMEPVARQEVEAGVAARAELGAGQVRVEELAVKVTEAAGEVRAIEGELAPLHNREQHAQRAEKDAREWMDDLRDDARQAFRDPARAMQELESRLTRHVEAREIGAKEALAAAEAAGGLRGKTKGRSGKPDPERARAGAAVAAMREKIGRAAEAADRAQIARALATRDAPRLADLESRQAEARKGRESARRELAAARGALKSLTMAVRESDPARQLAALGRGSSMAVRQAAPALMQTPTSRATAVVLKSFDMTREKVLEQGIGR